MPTTEKDGDKLANNDGKIVLGLDIPKTASQTTTLWQQKYQ